MTLTNVFNAFHDGDAYHIETSLLICKANQWNSFCMIGTSAIKELNTYISIFKLLLKLFNLIHPTVLFPYPLKTDNVFRRYKMRPAA